MRSIITGWHWRRLDTVMTYGEIKRAVLEQINQRSIAGELVADDYNNQSDYVSRIPNLITQAVTHIRTSVCPERNVFPVEQNGQKWEAVRLPSDCRRIVTGGIREVTDSGPRATNNYHLLGDRQIWFPPGEYLVEYEVYPRQLPAAPVDAYDFMEEPEVLQAAIYYAAAHLVRMDDAFSYQALYNEYQERLAALVPAPSAEIVPIEDVYGF